MIRSRLRKLLWSVRKFNKEVKEGISTRTYLLWLGLPLLRFWYSGKPVPLSKLIYFRQLIRGKYDPFFSKFEYILKSGENLHNPYLALNLKDTIFGYWSLSIDTLNLLEQYVQLSKPRCILEFGSGYSTLCLARYMQEVLGDSDQLRVISVDQEETYVRETTQLLEKHHLERNVKLITCPLNTQVIDGTETICYTLNDELKEILGRFKPDFVLIDGPSAEPGARFGTLPLILPYLDSESIFFLDDAIRDEELKIAEKWDRMPGVKVKGIHLVKKGLLIGSFTRNRSS